MHAPPSKRLRVRLPGTSMSARIPRRRAAKRRVHIGGALRSVAMSRARGLKLDSFPNVFRPCVRRCRAHFEPEEKAPALIAGSGADSRDGSVGMADCDFEIIDDDQDNPTDNHMYMLQTLTSPELTRVVIGSTSSEATADLHAEATRICKDEYHEVGLQTRCVAVWLHAARLQPLVQKKLGPPVSLATSGAATFVLAGDSPCRCSLTA